MDNKRHTNLVCLSSSTNDIPEVALQMDITSSFGNIRIEN